MDYPVCKTQPVEAKEKCCCHIHGLVSLTKSFRAIDRISDRLLLGIGPVSIVLGIGA